MSKNKKSKTDVKNVDEMTENVMTEAPKEIPSNFVLESGIPIPSPQRSNNKYPFKTMLPGQSFVIGKKSNAASVTISYWKKKLPGSDFVIRTLQNDEIAKLKAEGVLDQNVQFASRIWRTETEVK